MKEIVQANGAQHQALLRLAKKGESFLTALVRNVLKREDIQIISKKVVCIEAPEEKFSLLAMQAITIEGVTLGIEFSFALSSKLERRKHHHTTLSTKLREEFGLEHDGEPYLISLIYVLPDEKDQKKKDKESVPWPCKSDDCYVLTLKRGETMECREQIDILKDVLSCLKKKAQTIDPEERFFHPERKSRLRLKQAA